MNPTRKMLPPWLQRAQAFTQLLRLNRPIGILLLLWPTLWGLWVSAEGRPQLKVLLIFLAGVVLMRSAGCAINDYADRHIDGNVARTKGRPLVTGKVTPREALWLFGGIALIALGLAALTNPITFWMAVLGMLFAVVYPFAKRYTHLPQLVLACAWAWAIPMAFAAQSASVPARAWLLYLAAIVWVVAYDTIYAMVDRNDDLVIGVKSTAILFGAYDRLAIGLLQGLMLLILLILGKSLSMGQRYYAALVCVGALFIYQHRLISGRDREECFKAFLNNQWIGACIFAGIFLHYW